MKTIEHMVQQEISCCLSSLISTLANGDAHPGTALAELCDQALGLAMPIPDYEKAAIQAGWVKAFSGKWCREMEGDDNYDTAEDCCNENNIDPIDSVVFEHWAVSPWLAQRLVAFGEKVDTNFAGLNVWARTSKDQRIGSDGAIARIYAEMMKG